MPLSSQSGSNKNFPHPRDCKVSTTILPISYINLNLLGLFFWLTLSNLKAVAIPCQPYPQQNTMLTLDWRHWYKHKGVTVALECAPCVLLPSWEHRLLPHPCLVLLSPSHSLTVELWLIFPALPSLAVKVQVYWLDPSDMDMESRASHSPDRGSLCRQTTPPLSFLCISGWVFLCSSGCPEFMLQCRLNLNCDCLFQPPE